MSLQIGELSGLCALCRALVSGLVEKERRLFELEKNKNHHTGEEDKELHRQLADGIENEAETPGGERTAGEIALDLRLIGPEIRESEKESAQQTRPKSVALLRIDGEINCVELPHFPGDGNRLKKRHVRRQPMHDHPEGDAHAREDDGHLPFIGMADGSCAAG